MRSSLAALAALAVLAAAGRGEAAARAAAPHVELAGRVTASRTVLAQRRVGAPRYIAISDLFYRGPEAYLEVLDLAGPSVIQVVARRAMLVRRFGAQRGGGALPPQGEVVTYRDDVVGLALTEAAGATTRRIWYAELDARTGRLVRAVDLARVRDGDELQVVGADAGGTAAWFAITRRGARGRTLVLRRLDLASLAVQDAQRVALAVRAERSGREHGVRVHAAADFSRFAIVEYAEDGVGMAPGQIYVAEPATAGVFTVPAPPAAYGVAFSPDGAYAYVGSSQRGTVSRIDLVGQRIDKQVAGPRFLHHLVISPGGTRLVALASSSTYTVYDLPDLTARSEAAHPAGLAAAMAALHGNGIASLDGAFFVVPDAEDPRAPAGRDRAYVIARIVD